jgi:chromosome segregation ATPase
MNDITCQLKEKLESANKEHATALSMLEKENETVIDEIRSAFESRLHVLEEEQLATIQSLKDEKSQHALQLKSFFENKLQSLASEHKATLQNKEDELAEAKRVKDDSQSEVASARSLAESLSRDNDSLQNKLTAQIASEQSLKERLKVLEGELQDSIKNSEDTATSLLGEQEKLQKENDKLKAQMAELQTQLSASQNKQEELSGKLSALSSNLVFMAEEKKEQDQKILKNSETESKLKSTEDELNTLRDELNVLKMAQTKNNGLVSRLRAEKDASERKHGQRTALLGMLEAQLSEMTEVNEDVKGQLEATKYDLSQKEDEMATLKDNLEVAEKKLKDANDKLARANAKAKTNDLLSNSISSSNPLEQHQQQRSIDSTPSLSKESKKSKLVVDALQKEVATLQQQMARKSAAAQRLLQEREAECIELRKANKSLQADLERGSMSDQRLFELAANQSRRDTAATSEIEIRDQLVHNLTTAIINRDSELADVEWKEKKVQDEVEELSRVRRREDVNLDYLKSIIVQYLSKPPGSSERAALLPVLATLLQFDNNDYAAIEAGKQKVSWFWGSIIPTEISAPEPPPPPPPTTTRTHQSERYLNVPSSAAPSREMPARSKSVRNSSLQF